MKNCHIKKISICLCLIFVFCCAVVAICMANEGEISCKQISSSVVKITGAAQTDSYVTLNVLPADKTYDDLISSDNPISVIVYHNQTKAQNGTFSFRVALKESGEYTAYVKIGERQAKAVQFTYDSDVIMEETNPIIFEEDFENTISVATSGLTVSYNKQNANATIAKKDDAHGNSLHLQYDDTNMYLWKILGDAHKDKCVMVEFSYLRESTSNLFYMRYATSDLPSPERFSQQIEAGSMRHSYLSVDAKASVFRDGITSWDCPEDEADYLPEKQNDWNNVTILYDFSYGEISYFLNGNILYKTEIDIFMKDLYAIGWCGLDGGDIWIDNIRIRELNNAIDTGLAQTNFPEQLWDYSNRPVSIDFSSEKTGHIFGDTPAFDITYTEREGVPGDFNITYNVKDEYGNNVWSKNTLLSLDKWSQKTQWLELPVEKYGVYYLYVDAQSENHGSYSTFTQFSLGNFPSDGYHNNSFGMNLHVGQGREYEKQLSLADMAGVGIVRDELSWTNIETSENVWEFPEKQVAYWQALADKGITLYFCLNYTGPSWRGEIGSDTYIEGYGEWAYQMTKKFNELGLKFVIGTYNEWNHSGTIDPLWYAEMLKSCYNGVKRADPDVMVVGGETSGVPTTDLMKVLGALNREKYMDVWSHHIYPGDASQKPDDSAFVNETKRLRTLLDLYGYSNTPIWVTETGWSTMSGWTTEHQQAQFITRWMARNDTNQYTDVVFWYDFQNDGTYREPRESNFGVIESFFASYDHPEPMAAKPAYLSYANYNALIGDSQYVKSLNIGSDIVCNQYNKGSKKIIYVVSGSNQVISVNTDCEEFTIYDMYGNASPHYSVNGILTLNIGQDPIYVEGDFETFTSCTVQTGLTVKDIIVTKDGAVVNKMSELSLGDTIMASSAIINNTQQEKTYSFILAVYDQNELTDIFVCKGSVEAYLSEKSNCSYTVKDTTGISIKVFMWNENMTPYVKNATIE